MVPVLYGSVRKKSQVIIFALVTFHANLILRLATDMHLLTTVATVTQ